MVYVSCEWSCICLSWISMLSLFLVSVHVYVNNKSQGTETTAIFLTDIYMNTHKEQRQHRYSWQTYTGPLTRNRDNIDLPDRHVHDHSQGTDNIDIPDTHIHDHSQGTETISILGRSMLSLFLVSGHVYVCQEYRCCLCSLWLVMYICVRNIAVVSVPCE
jgi:hypothetical protein